MQKIILLVGESGSGKDSMAKMLETDGYKILKSYATRPKRVNEGDTHIFIKPEEVPNYKFDIVAYTRIGSAEYFATKQQLYENSVYIIDSQGVNYLKSQVSDIKFITIYINVNEHIRRQRARQRGDKEEVMLKRFVDEYEQFKTFKQNANFDYSICNYDINKAYRILKTIVETEMESE